jgi:signal transduction histidine kinase
VLEDHPQRERALGRLEDLRARLVALDGDLHRISVAVESPFLNAEALPVALARLADEFSGSTGIEPEMQLRGNLTDLTDSQQIALIGLIREALSNTREHSRATSVKITLTASASGIDATVKLADRAGRLIASIGLTGRQVSSVGRRSMSGQFSWQGQAWRFSSVRPAARNLGSMRLDGIQTGDIVEVDRLGVDFMRSSPAPFKAVCHCSL